MSLPSSGSRQQGRHDMKMKCFLKKIRLQLRYHQQGAKPPISRANFFRINHLHYIRVVPHCWDFSWRKIHLKYLHRYCLHLFQKSMFFQLVNHSSTRWNKKNSFPPRTKPRELVIRYLEQRITKEYHNFGAGDLATI